MKPEFNNDRWAVDGELFFRIRKTATGADGDSDDDEGGEGDDDLGDDDPSPNGDLVRLSGATKKQLLLFAHTLVTAHELADLATRTADQLRSHVRRFCLRRVVHGPTPAVGPSPDGAGAAQANPAVPLSQRPCVGFEQFDIDEIQYEELGPEQAVVVNILEKLAAEHPGHRYGTQAGQINLCGSVDPNALIELWLPGGWTDVLWSAAIRNRTRAPPPAPENDAPSPAFPALAPTSALLYGYDIPRLQLNAKEIMQNVHKITRPRVYIKSDVNRFRILQQTLVSFFADQSRVLGQSTDSLVRELADKMDLPGCESSIKGFLKNNKCFENRRNKIRSLAHGVAETDSRSQPTGVSTAQKRPRAELPQAGGAGGRHVPGSRTATLALKNSLPPREMAGDSSIRDTT
jgi:hypothetical protein